MGGNNNKQADFRRYLFVCGLHRSGTSLLTKLLSEHPQISGFTNTGAIEDEGQFLQTIMPIDDEHGGVGRFGFDPRAHLTEQSPLYTPNNAAHLFSQWSRYWDLTKPVLIEKSPANLLRMRLLSRFLHPSYFVVITRHPIAVSLASMKWEGDNKNLFSLIGHWVHCHRIARADTILLSDNIIWTSYEALIGNPQRTLNRILHFVNLPPIEPSQPELALQNANNKYFQLWKAQFFGDGIRNADLIFPKHLLTLGERVHRLLHRYSRDPILNVYPSDMIRQKFYDALDASCLWQDAIGEFGYSFHDLNEAPC